jgi:hypothetical protein
MTSAQQFRAHPPDLPALVGFDSRIPLTLRLWAEGA